MEASVVAERRRSERRGDWRPDCEVPCKPVDDKLVDVWKGISEKVTWKHFVYIVSGLGTVGVIILGIMLAMISHNQDAIEAGQKSVSDSFSELKADVRVQTVKMEEVQKDIAEIKRGVRRYNGGYRRWEKPNP